MDKTFKLGKYYKQSDTMFHIIGAVESTAHNGWVLIAESNKGGFHPVGQNEGSFTGWEEITKEEWMKNFNG